MEKIPIRPTIYSIFRKVAGHAASKKEALLFWSPINLVISEKFLMEYYA